MFARVFFSETLEEKLQDQTAGGASMIVYGCSALMLPYFGPFGRGSLRTPVSSLQRSQLGARNEVVIRNLVEMTRDRAEGQAFMELELSERATSPRPGRRRAEQSDGYYRPESTPRREAAVVALTYLYREREDNFAPLEHGEEVVVNVEEEQWEREISLMECDIELRRDGFETLNDGERTHRSETPRDCWFFVLCGLRVRD